EMGVEVPYGDETIGVREPNRAIHNEFRASNGTRLVDFLVTKMDDRGKSKVTLFNYDINRKDLLQSPYVDDSTKELYKQFLEEGLTKEEMVLRYASMYLPSYYTRFVPTDTTNDIESL